MAIIKVHLENLHKTQNYQGGKHGDNRPPFLLQNPTKNYK